MKFNRFDDTMTVTDDQTHVTAAQISYSSYAYTYFKIVQNAYSQVMLLSRQLYLNLTKISKF